MKELEITRIKEVGKKTVADFIRSETGSVGVKNAAMIAVFAGAFVLSQSSSNATTNAAGDLITIEIAI